MKRTLIVSGIVIVIAVIGLIIFNKVVSSNKDEGLFAEARLGNFEITIMGTGELVAEKSVDIVAPELVVRNQGGGGTGGHGGGDIRMSMLKIQDLVPEGTMVNKGDFIAQLDRTEYDNSLKDDRERLTTLNTNLELKLLDTAVVLTSLRDDIKNQKYLISEAELKYRNSKYESPDVIRQAEIALDKAKRGLEQKDKYYELRKAQIMQDIRNQEFYIQRVSNRATSLEELLGKFTITSPSDGMVVYKRDFRGTKRKVGTMISPFDRVVATIPDLSSMISRTFISEIDVNKVKKGLKADIAVDAFPNNKYEGTITGVANIGETMPNSDSKVFETLIRIEGSDPALRPSMTTSNKIIVKSLSNLVYIPTECIMSGSDSISFVYTKSRTKQIILPGESNDKNTAIEKGLEAGTVVYLTVPENKEKFKLRGEELIPLIRERNRARAGIAETR